MPYPDPEHEVRDVPGPADGDVETPDADPFPKEPRDRHAEKAEEREGGKKKEPPAGRCSTLDGLCDDLGDRVEIRRAQDERRTAFDRVVEQFCFRLGQACSPDLNVKRAACVRRAALYLPSRIAPSQASAFAWSATARPRRSSFAAECRGRYRGPRAQT